ncbi:MAG: heme-copper oxidase subunit III [Blastochloris sp.]|nr:heme-copper oxidase subunit III [Blastochloris sp.]
MASYYYLAAGAEQWPLGTIKPPDLLLPSINALILFSSSIPMYYADSGIRKGDQRRLKIGLTIGFVMGVIFLVLKYIEYSSLDYNWATNAYASIVWTITGFHSLHVIALLLKTSVILVLAYQNYFTEERHTGIEANGIYWHFVVAAWVPLFFTLYLAPRLL